MKRLIIVAFVCLIAGSVLAEDASAPDFAAMDKEALVILAKNQQRRIAATEAEAAQLKMQIASANIATDEARKSGEASSARVKELEAELAKLKAIIDGDPKLKAKLTKQQEIEKAISERRVVVGMTIEQANQAMGYEGKLIYESAADGNQYEWDQYAFAVSANRKITSGTDPKFVAEMVSRLADEFKDKSKAHYVVTMMSDRVVAVEKLD